MRRETKIHVRIYHRPEEFQNTTGYLLEDTHTYSARRGRIYNLYKKTLTMKASTYLTRSVLILCLAPIACAASLWSFDDATLSVQGKKAGAAGALKEKYATSQTII